MTFRFSPERSGRVLGAVVGMIAVLDTVSMATLPVREGRASVAIIVLTAVLLGAHALLYAFVVLVKERVGTAAYVAAQCAVLFAFGLLNPLLGLAVLLYVAAAIHTAALLAPAVTMTRVFFVLIALTAVSTALASNVYRGATVALALAVAGLAIAAISHIGFDRPLAAATVTEPRAAESPANDVSSSEPLTPRELEVLRRAAAGGTSKQIAAELSIAERTVKAHLASAYQKLGARTRAEAVAIAARRGLIV